MVVDGERSHKVDVHAAQERVSGVGGDHYDLLILGSGSTAFAAATRAKDLGKTAVMIEARTLGGTCVNRGCLPSKNLIAAAQLVYDARHPRFPGLAPVELPVDFRALIAQKASSPMTRKDRTRSRSSLDTPCWLTRIPPG